jgi:arylsulfatase A-like enzyme
VLLRELDRLGLRNRTIVVLASDHGEEFLEHGHEGHAKTLYREVVEVPWVVSLPFRLEPGIVVDATVENVDIWPTLLDLLGVPALPDADGQSRLPLIEAALRGTVVAPPEADAAPAFAQLDRRWGMPEHPPLPLVAVTQGPYRLILSEPAEGEPELELFDLRADPHEAADVAADQPEITTGLRQEAETYLARPPADWGTPLDVEISDLEAGQLRALGYVIR